MTKDERAIRDLVDTWMAATRGGDLETVLSLMADDVIFMVPGQAPFGKAAFAAQPARPGMQIDGRAEVLEVNVAGEWAFIRNHIEVTMTSPGEPAVQRAGYTLSILRKEADGRWRLVRDANLVA